MNCCMTQWTVLTMSFCDCKKSRAGYQLCVCWRRSRVLKALLVTSFALWSISQLKSCLTFIPHFANERWAFCTLSSAMIQILRGCLARILTFCARSSSCSATVAQTFMWRRRLSWKMLAGPCLTKSFDYTKFATWDRSCQKSLTNGRNVSPSYVKHFLLTFFDFAKMLKPDHMEALATIFDKKNHQRNSLKKHLK